MLSYSSAVIFDTLHKAHTIWRRVAAARTSIKEERTSSTNQSFISAAAFQVSLYDVNG